MRYNTMHNAIKYCQKRVAILKPLNKGLIVENYFGLEQFQFFPYKFMFVLFSSQTIFESIFMYHFELRLVILAK